MKNPQLTATPLAASADSHLPISASIPDIDEEMKKTQITATPLTASAGSHQLGSAINPDIEEEMNDPQVPAMHLAAAGSHQLISGSDFDANEIALDLPAEGSVLVLDT